MTEYLKNRKTNERYPINGCIVNECASRNMICGSAPPRRELPTVVNLKRHMTSVKHQGTTNSCTANAFSCAYEYLLTRYGVDKPNMSRLFIYYNSRVKDGHEYNIQDRGTSLNAALQSVKEYGACRGRMWPFHKTRVNEQPSENAYQHGRKYLTIHGTDVNIDLQSMKSCLADGYPFVFGIKTFTSFGLATKNNGKVPMPSRGERSNSSHGCHAMLAVGYSNAQDMFIVKNSWGTAWGDQGYCYIPYNYIADPKYCFEAVTIREITKDESENTNAWNVWKCDSCKKQEHNPSNRRYNCQQCNDFDLCGPCFDRGAEVQQHRRSHPMQCIQIKKEGSNATVEILTTPSDPIKGIHKTRVQTDSCASQPHTHYPPHENPLNAIDQKLSTKYLNWGDEHKGLHTGFYVTPQKGPSVVTSIRFRTGNDCPERDPMQFTLEGSNADSTQLTKGSSWVSICHGGTGLANDPGRSKLGLLCNIPNTKVYKSYRVLITSKRQATASSVQYTSCILYGKISVNQSAAAMMCSSRFGTDDDYEEENEKIGWNINDEIRNFCMAQQDSDNDADDWYIEREEY